MKYGWLKDLPDFRDYSVRHEEVQPLLKQMPNGLRPGIDLESKFPPVVNQGNIGSCTANAAAALVEYFHLNTYGKYLRVSRLFLYYCARVLGGFFPGDNGAMIRNVMGALVINGAPPEKYWPYNMNVDSPPNNFAFSMAKEFQTLKYYRLSENNKSDTVYNIKKHLSNGIPVIFGFTCYSSLDHQDVTRSGKVPFPSKNESMDGGHAVLYCGFDDTMVITNPIDGSNTTGAFKFRNSWGEGWGEKGYGWLPYKYVLTGLADDFWVLLSAEWLEIAQFV